MGEMEEADHIATDTSSQKCPLVCEPADQSCIDREDYALTGPVFRNPICKVYRFQTADSKWMLVREQMEECTLSFTIPRQLLSLYIQEDKSRLQDLEDLGELSPHWDNLRKEVVTRYRGIISSYQDTLAELEKITGSFKPSCCKAQKSLEFIPINLHTQRMRVTCPRKTEILKGLWLAVSRSSLRLKDALYDIITVGAPAAHFHGFKCGGLQRLLSRYEGEKKSFSTAYQCIYYSPQHTAKAQEVLSTVSLLQPLITSLADQLLQAALEHSSHGLKDALKSLSDKTEQFVHTLKDELVKSALLALHAARPGYVSKSQKQTPVLCHQQGQGGDQNHSPVQGLPGHSPTTPVPESPVVCNNVKGGDSGSLKHQDSIPHHKEYDEEEWDRVWANVAKCLNCVIAMVDKLLEGDNSKQEPTPEQRLADVTTSHNPGDWREQLSPLVSRLKECVLEVVEKAKRAMTFVLLQEAACSIPQGFHLQQRRDVVFSQALAALACGFVMRLYAGLQDKDFLRQLHLVGLVAQFESLLSTYSEEIGMLEDMEVGISDLTYSEEIGMLEDMEVGISDLQKVVFKITEAKTDDLSELQPSVCGRRDHFTVEVPLPQVIFQTLPEEIKEGKPLRVFPVLFNVGINEQQTIAERFGDISLQERINQKNFEILEAYYKTLREKVPLECLPCFQTQADIKELLETLGQTCFQTQADIKELLETLGQNVVTKKRKNVEILWIAGTICRRLNGIRFTSCKSAKDRTSMSVTLEQCALLRDEHQLSKDFFVRALDCMRSRLSQGDIGHW
ncbi:type II inositol 3,4-bisphosphate 4-phosphatase, partial [Fundulus heteroclitus]|uniref:type II inositol 3,4-bisphosphate 4-phosphatase n=1 Tax=Fundulus heteroclitus TaxID=8078 RepID=UPI00165BFF81